MAKFARLGAACVVALAMVGGVGVIVATPEAAARQEDGAKANAFRADPVHSSIMFRVKHMGIANFYGRFNEVSGSFLIEPEKLGDSFIDLTVNVGSVDTNSEGRDNHLKQADFFDSQQFPAATFKSTSIAKSGDVYKATGDFTLRGVTKQITIDVQYGGQQQGRRGGMVSGFSTEFEFDTTAYGFAPSEPGISNTVKLFVGMEGNRAG